jgi:hypothetical protein
MSEARQAVKLDFMSGLEALPPKPKKDASTTQASVIAGRELGFAGREPATKIDGRRLRSRGANTQLNLKVTADEKERILRAASQLIQDPHSPVSNIGEFVVLAVDAYKANLS